MRELLLVTSPNPKNLQILGKILSEAGYQVAIAENGEQALNSVKVDVPDLILLDVMMPVMDGYETCKHLKASNLTKEIPVIFLTAKTEIDEVIKGFKAGAVDYITKPFNLQEVCVRVKTHLTLSAAIKKLVQDSETDSLTGLLNRLTLLEKMENEAMHFKRNQKFFS